MRQVIKELHCNKLLLFQSVVFFLLSLSFIVTNGLHSCWWGQCGLYLGQWHMHDSLWHISLAKSGFNTTPFAHPFFAGSSIFGYNYLIDLILYVLSRLGIGLFFAFFRLMPVLTSLFYIIMSIKFALTWFKPKVNVNAVVFFLFFGSSLSYLATLYADHTFFYSSLRGFPVVTSIQPGLMFLNLQFALSLPLILFTLVKFKTSSKLTSSFWLAILIFIISGLKFYGGIVLSAVLLGMITIRILRRDRAWLRLLQMAAIVLGNLVALKLFYSQAESTGLPFAYWPMAIPHVLIDDPLLFNNHNWTLARYYLYEHGGLRSPRLIALESYTIFLLAIMNFGTRLIGVLALLIKSIRDSLGWDDLVILGVIILTFLMPVLFTQDGGWYNTMQFLYYGVFFASLYAGRVLSQFSQTKSWLAKVALILVIVLTLPNNLEQLRYVTAEQNVIPDSELSALDHLKNSPPGPVFISHPELKNAIVPAISGQIAYYLDVDQLMVTHVDYQQRQAEVKNITASNILSLPVRYYYLYKNEEGIDKLIQKLENSPTITKLAETDQLVIYAKY